MSYATENYTTIYIYIYNIIIIVIWYNYQAIGLMCRVFANGPEDWGSITGWVIPKTQKMVLDTALLSTQHYKVGIKGNVEQFWEWNSTLPYTLVL